MPSKNPYVISAQKLKFDSSINLVSYPTEELGRAATFARALEIAEEKKRQLVKQGEDVFVGIVNINLLDAKKRGERMAKIDQIEIDYMASRDREHDKWQTRATEKARKLITPRNDPFEATSSRVAKVLRPSRKQ